MGLAERLKLGAYAGVGALSHRLGGFSSASPENLEAKIQNSDSSRKPAIFFTLWCPPGYRETKKIVNELRETYGSGGKAEIGVALFVRPMGDVTGNDFCFDSSVYEPFFEATAELQMPVGLVASGMHWTEVAYRRSPLLRMLESDTKNLMHTNGYYLVPRKIQPNASNMFGLANGTIIPKAIASFFGIIDENGVVYLSFHSPEVKFYRERNFRQAAEFAAKVYKRNPGQIRWWSLENEVDYPGEWITKEKTADIGDFTSNEFRYYAMRKFSDMDKLKKELKQMPINLDKYDWYSVPKLKFDIPEDIGRRYPGFIWRLWQSFRINTVISTLSKEAEISRLAGLPEEIIYTNQSTADADNRASPLETANIPGCRIGITSWGTENPGLYRDTQEMAVRNGKKWALIITNPRSLSYRHTYRSLREPFDHGAEFIGVYNYYPLFPGYGVKGPFLPVERAIRDLTKNL